MGKTHLEGGDSVVDRLEDASNVLLAGPAFSASETATCMELLGADAPDDLNVLTITYKQNPEEWLSEFRAQHDVAPQLLQVIAVNDMARSVAVTADSASLPDNRQVETIGTGQDLTALGIHINEFLQRVEAAGDDGGDTTVVCFDSVTALLQFVDVRRAFRFLHVLTSQVDSIGARAHYHLNPDAIDDVALHTLQTLFDGRVTVDDEGVESVKIR